MASIRSYDAPIFGEFAAQCVVPTSSWVLSDTGTPVAVRESSIQLPFLSALKRLQCREGSIWYVIVMRLRCWIRLTEESEVPVRPYVIVLSSVTPSEERLITVRFCDPPDQVPSTLAVLQAFVGAVAQGPAAGDARHLPSCVYFDDADLATRAAAPLEQVGVLASAARVGTAPMRPVGVTQLRDDLSRRLAQGHMALVTPGSMLPGLAQGGTVSPALHRAFLRLAASFTVNQPWSRISERQTFRLRMADPSGGAAGDGYSEAWASVIGEHTIRARAEAARAAAAGRLGPMPPLIKGISIFFKRFDVERRCVVWGGLHAPARGECAGALPPIHSLHPHSFCSPLCPPRVQPHHLPTRVVGRRHPRECGPRQPA